MLLPMHWQIVMVFMDYNFRCIMQDWQGAGGNRWELYKGVEQCWPLMTPMWPLTYIFVWKGSPWCMLMKFGQKNHWPYSNIHYEVVDLWWPLWPLTYIFVWKGSLWCTLMKCGQKNHWLNSNIQYEVVDLWWPLCDLWPTFLFDRVLFGVHW